MFAKILIANRGEIATRIARTCAAMDIESVAIFSEADQAALHTRLADEAYPVGPAPVAQSYLNVDRILEIAQASGCDAIHPGYGLLSESPEFIERVGATGLTFVGSSARSVALMGDKAQAREFAASAGVAVVPGSDQAIDSEDAAVEFAEDFGYPLLVKAAMGGGGIGMKIATGEKDLRKAVAECQRRGESAFGSSEIYLERYVGNTRHVEIQVLADTRGNAIHLGERECSIQRRHQKVVEEAPSVLMDRIVGLRERMTSAALALVDASSYTNAGTVEFIVDESGQFYFIEMNTRLQVEHAVTEMITGLDLVELQLRVAAGQTLPIAQRDVQLEGQAIESRIYAENPSRMFTPAPGEIRGYREPSGAGIRVDSGVRANWRVSQFYDALIAKLIAHDQTRDGARQRALEALSGFVIDGLTNNNDMHIAILESVEFRDGNFHTAWLESWSEHR